jgi:pantoate--beta-alanine ligase
MKIVSSPIEMKNLSLTLQRGGCTVGLVPTMGSLHKGHLSLLERIRTACDYSVMSIFVNPTQFGPKEDFNKYPRPFEADCVLAESAGCDFLFAPSEKDIYPNPYNTYVSVENITEKLCGAIRPGHFRGVTTVVLKFFNIINPQIAVFGQKDAQQVVVIKRMVQDLNMSIAIDVAPIIRESDGLAMSSRNAYLTLAERSEASLIYKGLAAAEDKFSNGERFTDALKSAINSIFHQFTHMEVEYIEIVDALQMAPLETISSTALIAVACRTKHSKTRLIDNIVLGGAL